MIPALRALVLLLVFAGGWWIAGRLRSTPAVPPAESADAASFARGQTIYQSLCLNCHGADGQGTPRPDNPEELFAPSLVASRRVAGHPDYIVNVVLYGLSGPVDGQTYQEIMIPLSASPDEWIADVATYVRKVFGRQDGVVRPADVARIRAAVGKRGLWTVEELEASLDRKR